MRELPFSITPPEPIQSFHLTDHFDCGIEELNIWLQRRAIPNQESGASKTFIIHQEQSVIGYYSLASGAIARKEAPGKLKRNMPDSIPMIILGRLAVSSKFHGYGLGKALLKDALLRTNQAAQIIGVRGMIVHALNAEAKAFYESAGFSPFPNEPMSLYVLLKDLGI